MNIYQGSDKMGRHVSVSEVIEDLMDLREYIKALELEIYDYRREIDYLKGELERKDREIINLRREINGQ